MAGNWANNNGPAGAVSLSAHLKSRSENLPAFLSFVGAMKIRIIKSNENKHENLVKKIVWEFVLSLIIPRQD